MEFHVAQLRYSAAGGSFRSMSNVAERPPRPRNFSGFEIRKQSTWSFAGSVLQLDNVLGSGPVGSVDVLFLQFLCVCSAQADGKSSPSGIMFAKGLPG